jgi:ABC-2 type transport system ATP-binding protein
VFGLVRPDAGTATWRGEPIGPTQRLRFGYLPEERGLYTKMRTADQLAWLAQLHGMGRSAGEQAAHRWLAHLGLADRADSTVESLSHGNQQRVQLAAALVHDPELLVLDEPFAGLDPIGVDAVRELIVEQAERGVAVVLSSHQLDLVEGVCRAAVVINDGRVVMSGSLTELKEAAEHRHLTATVDGGTSWVPDDERIRVVSTDGDTVRMIVDRDVDPEQLVAAAARAGSVRVFRFEPPGLSALFREAVGGEPARDGLARAETPAVRS